MLKPEVSKLGERPDLLASPQASPHQMLDQSLK
jgi:hypothetical protein